MEKGEAFYAWRHEMTPEVEITKVSDGLGFGYGSISRESIEAVAGEDVAQLTDEAIQSPQLLIKIDETVQDDGCGDGRGVKRIFEGFVEKARSLNRAKVFGGAAAMASAGLIGTGRAVNTKLQEVFRAGISLLHDRQLDYGAHTADHVKNPDTDSGCGAIDNAPAIVEAAVTYKDKIRSAIALLGVETEGLDDVEENFAAAANVNRGQNYSGKAVMQTIRDDGKVVKELAGGHVETRIILNFVEGYTVDQNLVREKTGGAAEIFAVDVWRMKQLAEEMYDDPVDQHKAFLSELVYTLATAGVLTKGDLPVYAVQRPEFALAA